MTENLLEKYKVPPADELIAGTFILAASIRLAGQGEYKRGEILMKPAGGVFQKATVSGLQTADEVCLLRRDITIEDDETYDCTGYFTGTFNMLQVTLNGGNLNELSGAEQIQLQEILRKNKIFLR